MQYYAQANGIVLFGNGMIASITSIYRDDSFFQGSHMGRGDSKAICE